MVRLRVKQLIAEMGLTKYKLHQQMQMRTGISYGNFNNMIENRTSSIKYDNIDLLCDILGCDIGVLFERIPDKEDAT